ncbi:MAG: LysM peptidoglycan-binding domain-containing protein [Ardenticatenaceae bacterium]|nr:LysM peptidoglycan-binding domain-containing protein [Anaerolineales bacterium]MCB8920604.1 LysM peptidoglycan-binding domain-containing protein [Ardenticatenaceae bacterium]MCB8990228.1 LysM peptidoglycan-binding domain-containing protein [Ardenticatenaceae bacterium]MCB9002980.1 LysM peptidoglycan-binding domain-containing protein [Ardenticatenaceae bacterium]
MTRLLTILLILGILPTAVLAQDETATPTPPDTPIPLVHAVQEGENLTYIAQTYGITVEELLAVNGLNPDDVLFVGQSLIIPGGEGEAVATVYTVQMGDTLADIAAHFNTTIADILAANHAINPHFALKIGQQVTVISRTGSALPQTVTGVPHIVAPGESLLEIAARYRLSPQALADANGLPYPAQVFVGQRLRVPNDTAVYRYLPGEWTDIQIRPYPITQGQTVAIYVDNLLDGIPTGELAGQSLLFAPYGDGYAALIGLDAFTPPGSYTLSLSGSGNRPWTPLEQELEVLSGNYGTQYITVPEEQNALLAPEVRQTEDDYLANYYTQFRETQDWDALFQVPLTTTIITAPYGDSRSYNGGPIQIFHTGVDFGAATGTPVYAAANGVVVFSDLLQLRGNAVIIDHGRGVMTAYFHLSERLVTAGEPVTQGQIIALVGSTGLSSGPHLHWDLRILNAPVNGLQWTTTAFP